MKNGKVELKVELKNDRIRVLAYQNEKEKKVISLYASFLLIKNPYYKIDNGEEELSYNFSKKEYLIMDLKILSHKMNSSINEKVLLVRRIENQIIKECLQTLNQSEKR